MFLQWSDGSNTANRNEQEAASVKEITVPAAPDSVETVTAFVNEQLDAIRCPLPVR